MSIYGAPKNINCSRIKEKEVKMDKQYKIFYRLEGAYRAGVRLHPQVNVEQLGMKVLSYSPETVADLIIMIVQNMPDNLPSYIEIKN